MAILPIILSYNHPEHTENAVRSVLQHTEYKLTSHLSPLVLIHNGSEKKHVERLQKMFPTVDHFILQVNRGFSGGANTGITYAIQKYKLAAMWILFLTNDCELISWPSIDLVKSPAFFAPWIWMRKSDKIDSIGGKLNLVTAKPQHLKTSAEFESLLQSPRSHNEIPYIPGSAFLIHQSIFSALDGFDESFHTYWEDIDFSIRALHAQFSFGHLSNFKVKHKIGKTCHKDSHYTTYLYQRNRHRVCRKYITGIFPRILLELYLWHSWLKMSYKLLIKKRTNDFAKLAKGILDISITP